MVSQKKFIIYSVNTNNYDKYIFNKNLKTIFKKNFSIKYYIFTDKNNFFKKPKYVDEIFLNKISDTKYSFILNQQERTIEIPNGLSVDRFIKINPIEVLPRHDFSIYHDARVTLKPKIIEEIGKYDNYFDWLSMKHRFRKNFNEELLVNFAHKKINLQQFIFIKKYTIKSHFYKNRKYSNDLSENGLIIRKSNHKVKSLSKNWTNLTIMTIRDQASLPLTFFELKNMDIKRFFIGNFSESKICKLNHRNTRDSLIKKVNKQIISLIRFCIALIIERLIKIKII